MAEELIIDSGLKKVLRTDGNTTYYFQMRFRVWLVSQDLENKQSTLRVRFLLYGDRSGSSTTVYTRWSGLNANNCPYAYMYDADYSTSQARFRGNVTSLSDNGTSSYGVNAIDTTYVVQHDASGRYHLKVRAGWSISNTSTSATYYKALPVRTYFPAPTNEDWYELDLPQIGSGGNFKLKINGDYVDTTQSIKVGGNWKDITKIYTKVGGSWKE